MRIVSVKVNPIKINGERSQWGNGVCDQTYDLGVDAAAVLFRNIFLLILFRLGLMALMIEFCDFSPTAVLFATSPSSSFCKSLHIWKHSQQGVSARDHCGIRWVKGNLFWLTCRLHRLSSCTSEDSSLFSLVSPVKITSDLFCLSVINKCILCHSRVVNKWLLLKHFKIRNELHFAEGKCSWKEC